MPDMLVPATLCLDKSALACRPGFPLRYARRERPLKPLRAALDFEQAYEEHLGRVYAFFVYRLSSRPDAEDLTQQTFERALRSWSVRPIGFEGR